MIVMSSVLKNRFIKCLTYPGIIAAVIFTPMLQASDAEVLNIPTPAGKHSALSRVTTDSSGRLYLSWVTSISGVSKLYYSSFDDEKWSEADLIAQGDDWFVNWADFPFLAVNDNGMTAHWLQKTSPDTYDYDIKASFYNTENRRWRPGVTIHNDGVSAEHGFVSMLPMSDDRTFITWLDGRNTKASAGSHDEGHHGSAGMTLRAGIFDVDGKTLNDWELDPLTCDCCQTSAAMSKNGPMVVYRDRSESEIRDIYITRLTKAGWTMPVPVYADNWQIAGCPVNGPAIASKEGLTAVAWFTAPNDEPKVKLAISQNEGVSFSAPITVTSQSTNGRVGIAILESGVIGVSWLNTYDSEAELMLASYSPEGELLGIVKVADTKASRRSGFPVITSQDNAFYITWTDVSDELQVKMSRVKF